MRTLAFLVLRSLRQHALSTTVTAAAAALACGLVLAVFNVTAQTRDAFVRDPGFDAVLGARGSPLQLVLNSVFHLETSPGNIPWTLYEEFRKDPRVEVAIPYAVGDNYRGFRIVGTTPEVFGIEYAKGRRYVVKEGRTFEPDRREAVVGSIAARATGLKLNDRFHPAHGTGEHGEHEHEDLYNVVGILAPTNTPADRVVWIPIEGIFHMEGHVLRGGGQEYQPKPDEKIADEHKEVSAVMLRLKSEGAGFALQMKAREKGATLAWPVASVMQDLFDRLFWFVRILEIVAYLVVAVSVSGILASLYNTMNERRREFAILRALGARRATVFSAVVCEAAAIAAAGALAGFLVYALVVAAATYTLRVQTGVVLDPLAYHPVLWAAPLGIVLLGALSGLLPALKAYRTDVATNLAPTS